MKVLNVGIAQTKKINNSLLFLFSIFMTLCFSCVIQTEDMYQDIFVFYLNVNPTYVLIGICLLFFAVSLFKRKLYIDRVTVLLFYSAVLGIIPFLYADNTNNYWGNYLALIISLISYFVCSQSDVDVSEKIYNVICLVCVIVSLQVIATELNFFKNLSFSNFSNVSVKGFMRIPIGSSNTIAAYLLPMIVFINSFKRSKMTVFISVLTVYALILCRSKNALSLVILIVSFYVAKKVYNFIIKDKSVSKKTKLFIISFITAIFGAIFIYILSVIGSIISELQFSYNSSYADPFLNYLDGMTSGRISVFQNELNRFTKHFFLGNGFGYDFGFLRSHNWIIELLVQKGMIGFTIYTMCVLTILKIAFKNYKDNFSRASFYLLLVIYIQGLFEITVFNSGIDFLIWSTSGFVIVRARVLNKQNNKEVVNVKLNQVNIKQNPTDSIFVQA